MQQTVDFRDYFEQAFRVLPVSRFHAEPHPMLSLFAFHFALRRSLATAQSKPFGAAIVSGFCSDPAWQPSQFDAYDFRILATSVSQIVGSSEKVDTSASGNFSQLLNCKTTTGILG